ncbi:MAG: serine protein kinase, partial [Betaproteobacteria bacterium]|nr:serine protein kinase [Betaproteobacteria bacterium]
MNKTSGINSLEKHQNFVKSLVQFSQGHRAVQWSGTFGEFVEKILANDPRAVARNSHEYIWDMIRWQGCVDEKGKFRCKLFDDELFGIDDPLARLVDYFKAASAGAEVGRRLLLLLGPPSGGKSTLVILLKRGLEEYSHTETGAIYGIQGCPVHEAPLHLVAHTLRPTFRETYGVEITGELCPFCASRLT